MTTKIELDYDYPKLKASLRYWLQGRDWHLALQAMEMGLAHHNGVRKNGNPEFSHQVFQAQFARTLSSLLFPEETLAVIFLHDIVEDHDVSRKLIYDTFGSLVGEGVELMTDADAQGTDLPPELYYPPMADHPVASICKGIDRMHNLQSMLKPFSVEKQQRYIEETRVHIIPMMKTARKKFTEQEPAYQNVKHVLLTQIHLIEAMHVTP